MLVFPGKIAIFLIEILEYMIEYGKYIGRIWVKYIGINIGINMGINIGINMGINIGTHAPKPEHAPKSENVPKSERCWGGVPPQKENLRILRGLRPLKLPPTQNQKRAPKSKLVDAI